MKKENTTNTTATATTTNTAQEGAKNMKTQETKATTTQTTATATKKSGLTARGKATQEKARTKDNKKTSSKKSTSKKSATKAPETAKKDNKEFYVEAPLTANLVTVEYSISAKAVNNEIVYTAGTTTRGHKLTFPKSLKEGQLENYARLVQGKVFDYQNDKLSSELIKLDATISESDSGIATPEQEMTKKAIDMAKKQITVLRKKYKTGVSNTVTDALAQLLAFQIIGNTLTIDVDVLKSALMNSYNTFHSFAETGAKEGKASMTEEDKNNVKAVRTALVETMSKFCIETTWNKAFKLSASASDAVYFYERSISKTTTDEVVYIWTTNKKDELSKDFYKKLATWLLRKMKAEVK